MRRGRRWPRTSARARATPAASGAGSCGRFRIGKRIGTRFGHACGQALRVLREGGRYAKRITARIRLVDRPRVEDPPRVCGHHRDARREEYRFVDAMRDEYDGHLLRGPERKELTVEALSRELVERAERLVHQQQVGLGD